MSERFKYGVTANNNDEVSIDSSLLSNVFEGRGRCLDLLFVDDYESADFLESKPK
jgi:hypothetical protein